MDYSSSTATSQDVRPGCVAEAIYELREGNSISPGEVRWHELLCRPARRSFNGHKPLTPAEWRGWYSQIGGYVELLAQPGSDCAVSVNVSTEQLMDEAVLESLRALRRFPITLEWTEEVLPEADHEVYAVAARRLESLRRDCGYRISIDDVGAGEDGFGRVAFFEEAPDSIKLDGSLLKAARVGRHARKLTAAQVSLYQQSGSKVVLEHVETQQDLEVALTLGANYVQGWFLGEGRVLRLPA